MPQACSYRGPKVKEVAGKHPENSYASLPKREGAKRATRPGQRRRGTRVTCERAREAGQHPGAWPARAHQVKTGLGKETRKVPPPQCSRGSRSHKWTKWES